MGTEVHERYKVFRLIQGPLVVVVVGVVLGGMLALEAVHLVSIPVAKDLTEFKAQFTSPDFSTLGDRFVWQTGLTIAIVASLGDVVVSGCYG